MRRRGQLWVRVKRRPETTRGVYRYVHVPCTRLAACGVAGEARSLEHHVQWWTLSTSGDTRAAEWCTAQLLKPVSSSMVAAAKAKRPSTLLRIWGPGCRDPGYIWGVHLLERGGGHGHGEDGRGTRKCARSGNGRLQRSARERAVQHQRAHIAEFVNP